MRSYGIDLREHTLAAYARGEGSIRDVAEQFGVAPRTVVNWLALARTTGSAEPRPHGGGAQVKMTSEQLEMLLGLLRDDLDATLPQLAERLAQATGCVVSMTALFEGHWIVFLAGRHASQETRGPARHRIRCTDPVLFKAHPRPHGGHRWARGPQRDDGGCSGRGIVSLPMGVASSVGSRRARVAAHYLGASSR